MKIIKLIRWCLNCSILKRKMPVNARRYVRLSAKASSFAPISVSCFNILARNPSIASESKLITRKITKRNSLPFKAKNKIRGKTSSLYIVIIFGTVRISFLFIRLIFLVNLDSKTTSSTDFGFSIYPTMILLRNICY